MRFRLFERLKRMLLGQLVLQGNSALGSQNGSATTGQMRAKMGSLDRTPQNELFEGTGHRHASHHDSVKVPDAYASQHRASYGSCKLGEELQVDESRVPNASRLRKERTLSESHFFRIRHNLLLCVPQKNGNHNFGGLAFRIQNHKVPSGHELRGHRYIHESGTYGLKSVHSQDNVLFIARNPYARLLSAYLQKIARMVEKGEGEMKKAEEKQAAWVEAMGLPSTPDSFTDFVRMIKQKLSSGSNAAFPESLCSINRHLCSQVSGCTEEGKKVTLLKLELQPKWFPCFAHTLGIGKDELEGDQWQSFAGKPCFYTPTKNCSDWAKANEPPAMIPGHDHATGATSHITEHYTPEAARLVSEIYSDDIATLGYPKWDGESPFEMV